MRAQKPKDSDNSARIPQLMAEIGNIANAIASGELRAFPTMANRLATAEAELRRLETAAPPVHLLFGIGGKLR